MPCAQETGIKGSQMSSKGNKNLYRPMNHNGNSDNLGGVEARLPSKANENLLETLAGLSV